MSDLILILDDELSYAKMVSELLESHGYRTDVCTQPREALERLHQHSYGLIISDYKMPDINGAELLDEVRKVLPHIPVIMVSGLMGKAELLRVANIGVTLVLEKPFNVPAFLEHVGRFVQSGESGAAAETFAPVEAPAANAEDLAYPHPATHVVDGSQAMQRFLNQFWQHLENFVHVILVVPEGGEIEPLMREATAWIGDSERAPFRLSLTDLDRPDARERLVFFAGKEDGSPLVAVTVPDQTEVDLARMERFFQWTREAKPVAKKLRFVFALPDVIEARQFVPRDDLADVVSKPLSLPPLRERLIDLGGWVERTLHDLGPERVRPLATAAAELILQQVWTGNQRELTAVVRRALALARRGEISIAAVQLAMEAVHSTASIEREQHGIGAYLQAEQARFLEQHLPKKDRFDALAKIVGGRIDRLRADCEIKDQPLLFEALAETVTTS